MKQFGSMYPRYALACSDLRVSGFQSRVYITAPRFQRADRTSTRLHVAIVQLCRRWFTGTLSPVSAGTKDNSVKDKISLSNHETVTVAGQ